MLQPSIVVMTDVHGRLPHTLTDLMDGQTLEEMKFQSGALIFCKGLQGALQVRLPVTEFYSFRTTLTPQILNAGDELFRITHIIEIPSDQVFATIQCAVIRHPSEPGPR